MINERGAQQLDGPVEQAAAYAVHCAGLPAGMFCVSGGPKWWNRGNPPPPLKRSSAPPLPTGLTASHGSGWNSV
jgi:hypothetical protein